MTQSLAPASTGKLVFAALAVAALVSGAVGFVTWRQARGLADGQRVQIASLQKALDAARATERQDIAGLQNQTGATAPAPVATGTAPPAGNVPAPVAMVVDVDGIVANSQAGKDIESQVNALGRQYQTMFDDLSQKLQAKKQELDTEQQELAKGTATISEQAFRDNVQEFDKELQNAQSDSQTKKRELDAASQEALGKINQALYQIIHEIAEERHANLVLQRGPLIFYDNSYDATREAFDRLNKTLPSVQVVIRPLPESDNEEPAAAAGQAPASAPTNGADPGAAPGGLPGQ